MAGKHLVLPGDVQTQRPVIRQILAPNPSIMTQNGTNTFILGSGDVAVIDPGPDLPSHLDAILSGLSAGERITHILVTHAHLDHSGLAGRLANVTGASVHAFGSAMSGRSATMIRLAKAGLIGGGEGLDHAFSPDIILTNGARLTGKTWAIEAIHTPGHLGGHLCFASSDLLFSGDHVMGWSTSLVSPPDGDMTDYMASLELLAQRQWGILLPAHGDPVTHPSARIAELIAHRRAREAAVLDAIGAGAKDISAITQSVYPDLSDKLLPAAKRNILAHLIDIEARKLIEASPEISAEAIFSSR